MQLNFSTAPSGNQPTVFTFDKMDVRVIRKDGEPWFVASDVCEALTIGNVSDAVGRLDDDEKGIGTVDTLGGAQEQAVINESGLYSLTLTSRKPAAKRFKKWVTSEVLPSIRKTGTYTVGQPQPAFQIPATLSAALRLAAEQAEQIEQQQAQLAITAPKAQALDRIAQADGEMCITNAAKTIGVQPKKLFEWMERHDWIYRRPGSKRHTAYQARIKAGYLTHKVTTVERFDGSEKVVESVIVTPKGLAKLAEVAA